MQLQYDAFVMQHHLSTLKGEYQQKGTYQALILTPNLIKSAKFSGSSCVLRLMFSAGIPASMARLTSNPEEASMWIPFDEKNLRIAEFGDAFMAYLTVNP